LVDAGAPCSGAPAKKQEANYCPTRQTGGRLLADRALSRLLKQDWPQTLEELEARKRSAAER
jgi:formamidopyrimidine-DNA glycosylase